MSELDDELAEYRRRKELTKAEVVSSSRPHGSYTSPAHLQVIPASAPPAHDYSNELKPPYPEVYPPPDTELFDPVNLHGFLTVPIGSYDLADFFDNAEIPTGLNSRAIWRLITDSTGSQITYHVGTIASDGKLNAAIGGSGPTSGSYFDTGTKGFVSTYDYPEGMWLQVGSLIPGYAYSSSDTSRYNWLPRPGIAGGNGYVQPMPAITGLASSELPNESWGQWNAIATWDAVEVAGIDRYIVRGSKRNYVGGVLVSTSIVNEARYTNDFPLVEIGYTDPNEDLTAEADTGFSCRIQVSAVGINYVEGPPSGFLNYISFPATRPVI